MDLIRLLGVAIVEYPVYLCSTTYDYSRFWNKCIRINVLYTKLVQSFAINYMSDKFQYEFNNIPYTESEIPDIEFITPTKIIGSGMISIVMEGNDKNGNLVVVKAKRKNIHDKIMNGLRQIQNIFHWLKYIHYFNSTFNLNFMYTIFETMIVEQLYFDIEIKNHKKFKQSVAYNQNIVVPELYEEYCTDNQIVMSKIDGTHISNIPFELNEQHSTYLTQMIVKNIILDGFIHSDLHAGNIIITPDNKIGIIDFGLMIQLSNQVKLNLFDLFKYMNNKQYDDCANIIYNEFIGPDEYTNKLTVQEINNIKINIKHVYLQAYEITKYFSHSDIMTIITFLHQYKLQVNCIFYKFMLFIISYELLIKKISSAPMDIFTKTLQTIYSELNTDNE
jgi:predicted unusual protein kinase regulating ubiquinone biosynthesis (AarF/ABC1/UbiB family)